MDPLFWGKVLQGVIRYWYIVVIVLLLAFIWFLRTDIKSKSEKISTQNTAIALKEKDVSDLKAKLDLQSKAVDDLAKKGKEQAARLDTAIQRVNDMKPVTQVILREIYTDKSKTADELLLHALSD